jgi:hypothetical protein
MAKASRGFGFVLFKDANTMKKVLSMNTEHKIMGKVVSFRIF